MFKLSRFNRVDGKLDEHEVEVWAESYFYNLMNIFNAFFTRVDISETVDRMSCIPFDELLPRIRERKSEIIDIAK